MIALLILAALALAGFVGWCRSGRSIASRWWVGDRLNESAILFWLPALAVVLLTTAALRGYDDGNLPLRLLLVPGLLGGLLLSLWGGLFLPVPRWYVPRWARESRGPALQVRMFCSRRR